MPDPHVFVQDPDGVEGIDCARCTVPAGHPLHAAPALPDTPYAGTSGWSGSETSRERAEDADEGGTTTARQSRTLLALHHAGTHGLTWRELADENGWHHGQASGALSVLHKEGRIVRLADERRQRCAVYVHPDYVEGRDAAQHGRERLSGAERAALERAEEALGYGRVPDREDARLVVEALRRLAR